MITTIDQLIFEIEEQRSPSAATNKRTRWTRKEEGLFEQVK